MKDIKFVEPQTCVIAPTIKGKIQTQGLAVYQKVLTLMLSSSSDIYRQKQGTSLLNILEGSNTPPDDILQAIGMTACSQVLLCLDSQDVQLIKQLRAQAINGSLNIHLQLIDGTIYKGQLAS